MPHPKTIANEENKGIEIKEEKWREGFRDKFQLSFFATEDWEYDYKNNLTEFQFRSWQERNTNIAKTKQYMIESFISNLLLSQRQELEAKHADECNGHIEKYKKELEAKLNEELPREKSTYIGSEDDECRRISYHNQGYM